MKRKIIGLSLTAFILIACVGCSGQTLTEYQDQNNQTQGGTDTEQAESVEQSEEQVEEQAPLAVTVNIYSSNSDASGFETNQVELDSLSPEKLVKELAKVNVVSHDTEVISFNKEEKSLTLDLSSEFSNYINMMGTTGEYIVAGALVNTFLDAYEADDILITVKGKALETSHSIYDKPLNRYENESAEEATAETANKEPMKYRLKETALTQDEKQVFYPQFDEMSNESLQSGWNQSISDIVMNQAGPKDDTAYESYKVDYKIGYCAADKISFIFTRKTVVGGETKKDYFTLNFDLVEGKSIRFGDLSEAMETISYNMANQGYFKVANSDLDREAYDEYFDQIITDAKDYREMFLRYDYDLTDLSAKPEGFVYINASGEIELYMEPVEALSEDQLHIMTGVKVK